MGWVALSPCLLSWNALLLVPFRWKHLRQEPQGSTLISWQAFPKAFYAKDSEA